MNPLHKGLCPTNRLEAQSGWIEKKNSLTASAARQNGYGSQNDFRRSTRFAMAVDKHPMTVHPLFFSIQPFYS